MGTMIVIWRDMTALGQSRTRSTHTSRRGPPAWHIASVTSPSRSMSTLSSPTTLPWSGWHSTHRQPRRCANLGSPRLITANLEPQAANSSVSIGDLTFRDLMSLPLLDGSRPPLLTEARILWRISETLDESMRIFNALFSRSRCSTRPAAPAPPRRDCGLVVSF